MSDHRTNHWFRRNFDAKPSGAKIIPFPGVNLDPNVTPPQSINARHAMRLGPAELERLQAMRPFACQLCGADVYPIDAMWWDATGYLHNYTCRPKEAV